MADLPNPCSIQHLVKYFLEISALPREYFWQVMSCLKGEGEGCGDDYKNGNGEKINYVGGEINVGEGNNNGDRDEENKTKEEEAFEMEQERLKEFCSYQNMVSFFFIINVFIYKMMPSIITRTIFMITATGLEGLFLRWFCGERFKSIERFECLLRNIYDYGDDENGGGDDDDDENDGG